MLDDTLIYYIIGDNGASAEGTMNGCFNEMTTLNGMPGIETTEFLLSKIDDFGTPEGLQPLCGRLGARALHALSVDQAGRLALGWHAQWHDRSLAQRLKGKGEIRSQFHHVIDVAKTILEAAGLPEPTIVNSIAQAPLEGVSMAPSFTDAKAPETHEVQYFEMIGNRGIYHKGGPP